MKRMSFSLTRSQIEHGTKTVTRRFCKSPPKVGERRLCIQKGMGLKPGEQQQPILNLTTRQPRVIEFTKVSRDPLRHLVREPEYGRREARLEGFPQFDGLEFVEFFCRHGHCKRSAVPYRLEFKYLS